MPISQDVTKLSVVLDFDGCTSTVEARSRLIDHIKDISENSPKITEIDVSIGSTRGTSFMNDFNAYYQHSFGSLEPMSCAVLGTNFIGELIKSFKPRNLKISFDGLLLGDILNNLSYGASFKLMYQNSANYKYWLRGEFSHEINGVTKNYLPITHIRVSPTPDNRAITYSSDDKYVNDEYKILMMYMQMHHKASLDPNKEFVLDFYDDRADILHVIQGFYSANPDLMPSNCCLRINQFYVEGYPNIILLNLKEEKRVIQGKGKVNPLFAEDICRVNIEHVKLLYGDALQYDKQEALKLLQDCILKAHKNNQLEASSTFTATVSEVGMFKRSATSADLTSLDKENKKNNQVSKKVKVA